MDLAELPTVERPRVLSPEEATVMVGTKADPLDPNVTTPQLVVDADTRELVAAYYPLTEEHRASLRSAVMGIDMGETYRSASGRRNKSRVFGMSPRKSFQRRESCRPTALAADQPQQHATLVAMASLLARDLWQFAPDVAERDTATLGPVLDEWRMSESSLWTSGVVNKSSTLPYHRDGFNFPVWSAMPVLRRGVEGGHLHIAEYDLVVGCRDGWVVYFPGYLLLHGVTPMRVTAKDGYRFSVVYYALKGMKDCHTYAVETAEGGKRRTAREEGMAASATGRAPSRVVVRPRVAESPVLFDDYAAFHDLAVASGDIDPVYPVLTRIGDELDLDPERRLWLTALHVAYYHLGSALRAFAACPSPAVPDAEILRLPTGTERRSHRVPARLEDHLRAVASLGGLSTLGDGLPADPRAAWAELNTRLTGVRGNGRWAAYKTAEMLQKVNGWPVEAPDMGHAHSSGPRQGLALLYPALPDGNDATAVRELDLISDGLVDNLRARGLTAGVEQVETTLCDFHALHAGRYYVGHDIDQMLGQIGRVPSDLTDAVTRARAASFAPHLLGEVGGWTDVRRELKTLYRDSRQLRWWEA